MNIHSCTSFPGMSDVYVKSSYHCFQSEEEKNSEKIYDHINYIAIVACGL